MKAKKERKLQFVCQILDCPPLDPATSPSEKTHPKGWIISPEMAKMFDACYIEPSKSKDPYVSPVHLLIDKVSRYRTI